MFRSMTSFTTFSLRGLSIPAVPVKKTLTIQGLTLLNGKRRKVDTTYFTITLIVAAIWLP